MVDEPHHEEVAGVSNWLRGLLLLTTTSMLGCTGLATADDVPARLLAPTEASRAELQRVVNKALRTNVRLAPDALTRSSVLSIERSPPAGIGKQPTQGRNMDAPIQFRLVMNGKACVLIDQRTTQRYVLEEAYCVAE